MNRFWQDADVEWQISEELWNEVLQEVLEGCSWQDVDFEWDSFDRLWNDTLPCIKKIAGNIILGAPPEEAYVKAVGKDKKLHRKMVKLIMMLKDEEIIQQKEIYLDKYKVTAGDVNILMEQYYKNKNIPLVTIDEILVR